jgi:hypothetical protein
MILANAIGMFVFAYIVRNFQDEQAVRAERDALLEEKKG